MYEIWTGYEMWNIKSYFCKKLTLLKYKSKFTILVGLANFDSVYSRGVSILQKKYCNIEIILL